MFINIFSLFSFLSIASVVQAEDWVNEPCVDWESTAVAYEEAYAKWDPPSCYTFSFTYMGFIPEPARERTVIHGESVLDEDEPYQDLRTLDDFWNLYRKDCFQDCPISGAYSCSMKYAMSEDGVFMYPSSVSINYDKVAFHEGFDVGIENVRSIPCPEEGEDEPHDEEENLITDAVNEPCVNWETTVVEFEEAYAQWEPPTCYTFTYSYLGFSFGQEPTTRTVVHGKSLQDGDGQWLQTLDDVWSLIHTMCVRDCPTTGAHLCDIDYARNEESGFMYPAFVDIDVIERMTDEEAVYRIEDVRSIPCPEAEEEGDNDNDEDVKGFTNPPVEPCVNWETTAAEYEEAFAQWKPPSCYTFTYTFFGDQPVTQTVVRGKSSLDSGYDQTLDDFWNMIQSKCIQDCPTSGAYSCDIKYAMNEESGFMYPSSIDIDEEYWAIDDESFYVIEDVRAVPCPEERVQEKEEEVMDDNQKTKKVKKHKKENAVAKKEKENKDSKSLRKKGKGQMK